MGRSRVELMEESGNFLKKIEGILEKDPSYKFEAYTFVLAALHDTVSGLKKSRHITGQELALGIRKYALDQFGPMVKTVLHHWGIRTTLDFGKIVYALIDVQLLSKQPEDRLEDFDKVYEFEESFGKYKISDE
ncbi:MAG: Minf_1886 family protein [Candidatus Omnitrophota bacterium]